MPSPRVSVVVVGYHSESVLPRLLHSLRAQSLPPIEVILADNSEESLASRQIAADASVTYLHLPTNPGYGAAANAGARALTQDWEFLLVCNPDLELAETAIERLAEAARRNVGAGSLGPKILNIDGSVYPSARRIPDVVTGAGHAILGPFWPRNRWTQRYLESQHAEPDGEREAGWLSGACLLLRRAAFESVSGFDESYFMYFEDVDLGYRLRLSGWTNVYVPSAEAIHSGAHSTSERRGQMQREHHRSAARFVERRYPGIRSLPLRFVIRIGLRVRFAVQQASVLRRRATRSPSRRNTHA